MKYDILQHHHLEIEFYEISYNNFFTIYRIYICHKFYKFYTLKRLREERHNDI